MKTIITKLKTSSILLLFVFSVALFFIIFFTEQFLFKNMFPVFSVTGALIILFSFLFVFYLRIYSKVETIHNQQQKDYLQIEGLLSLYKVLDVQFPITPLRGWIASPDYISIIVQRILSKKPNVVVECGSGVSSIFIAYALKKNGFGKLYSLDNDESYAKKTQYNILNHELKDYAEVFYAPLKKHKNGLFWYDYPAFFNNLNIDIVIVDGPPNFGKVDYPRYPVVPILKERFNKNAVLIVDDYNRTIDKGAVMKWIAEFGFKLEEVDTEKGTALLYC